MTDTPGSRGDGGSVGPWIGDVVADRYVIEAVVPTGTHLRAFRARDRGGGPPVLLKMPPAGGEPTPRTLARLQREYEMGQRVRHPNILQVWACELDHDPPFVCTEYLSGGTLQGVVQRGERLDGLTCGRIMADVALGLARIHHAGLVHRDVSPPNIMFTSMGHGKLGDLGITCEAGPIAEDQPLTAVGFSPGTPAYMSPEQVRGGPVSPATDVYGCGAVLYEALAGRPYVELDVGDAAAVREAILHDAPRPAPAHVPPNLVLVMMRCLRKDPGERFPDARAFHAALDIAVELDSWRRIER